MNVTVQVDSWGAWTDRLYDMYFALSLVWSGGHWNSTFRNIPEINSVGVYNFTIFGIALNEGEFGSLANNEEVPMTMYYYLEVTEGVILGPDITSYGQLDVFGVTYRNVEATPTGGLYDVVLPPIYTNRESKMSISFKTNEEWKTNKAMTIIVTFSIEEFRSNVDRFYDLQFTFWFKSGGYSYSLSPSDTYQIFLGYSRTHYSSVEFADTTFGGFGLGEEKTIELWYDINFKEGVIGDIDPQYTLTDRYAFDFTLKHEGTTIPPGDKESHVLNLVQQTTLSHVAAKSWIWDGLFIYLNFTLFFAFNVYLEMDHDISLDSYIPEEISTLNPIKLYVDLVSNNVDISFGAKPILGCIIHWIDKSDMSEYTFEITDLPVPTPTDVDGDGSYITIMSKTVYLWDTPIWVNGSLVDTFGAILKIPGGVTIDIFEINLLDYIGYLLPGVVIPGWLAKVNFILAIHIYPLIYQLFYLNYLYSAASMTLDDNGYYGLIDDDTTDTFDIDPLGSSTITPDGNPSNWVECTPGVYTYASSIIYGSIDVELEILGFTIFRFPIINIASDFSDCVDYDEYSGEMFTKSVNYAPPTTPPTTPPTSPPTTPPTTPTTPTTPSDTTTPEAAIGLLVPVISVLISIPIIIIIRRKKKEH